jgi:hypothetical protein
MVDRFEVEVIDQHPQMVVIPIRTFLEQGPRVRLHFTPT